MTIDLSSASHEFIQGQVAQGNFASAAEALEAAVDLLRQRETLAARHREGCRQIEQGEYVSFDRDGLRDYFDQLKQQVLDHQKQQAASNAS